jgi:hypothetical protein
MTIWIAFGFAPASIKSEAKVWRHSWRVRSFKRTGARSSSVGGFPLGEVVRLPSSPRPAVDGGRIEDPIGGAAEDAIGSRPPRPDELLIEDAGRRSAVCRRAADAEGFDDVADRNGSVQGDEANQLAV